MNRYHVTVPNFVQPTVKPGRGARAWELAKAREDDVLMIAAQSDSQALALSTIMNLLKMDERSELQFEVLIGDPTWRLHTPAQRAMMIGDWLRAEMYERAELLDACQPFDTGA